VQRHDATRLHYDLRLEVDGVLVCWAVPKGPSPDPAVKRLAVRVEDHALAHATFERQEPTDRYRGGDCLIWDRGSYDTTPPGQARAQLQKGHLHLELRGQKLLGGWHLLRTPGRTSAKEQWLLFKARDAHARTGYDVVADRPGSVVSGRRIRTRT